MQADEILLNPLAHFRIGVVGNRLNTNYPSCGIYAQFDEFPVNLINSQGKILEAHTYDDGNAGTSLYRANGVEALTLPSF